MEVLALMFCAMLAGAAPLALLFVPLLLPAKPVPEPEPEYVPDPEYEANLQAHLQHMRDCVEFGWDR